MIEPSNNEELRRIAEEQTRHLALPSAEEIAAELRRLIDAEPQPTPTTQGMTAAQARAELDAITRGTTLKE